MAEIPHVFWSATKIQIDGWQLLFISCTFQTGTWTKDRAKNFTDQRDYNNRNYLVQEPITVMCRCRFARDVTTAMLEVKNKSISLLWELNSIFMWILLGKILLYWSPNMAAFWRGCKPRIGTSRHHRCRSCLRTWFLILTDLDAYIDPPTLGLSTIIKWQILIFLKEKKVVLIHLKLIFQRHTSGRSRLCLLPFWRTIVVTYSL